MEMIFSNMYPILWLIFMFGSVVAFIVAAVRSKPARRVSSTPQPAAVSESPGMEPMEMPNADQMNFGDDVFK